MYTLSQNKVAPVTEYIQGASHTPPNKSQSLMKKTNKHEHIRAFSN